MNNLKIDVDWFENNFESGTRITNICLILSYDKAAEKLMNLIRRYKFDMKTLFERKQYNAVILRMKLNNEFESTFIDYNKFENYEWPRYINETIKTKCINKMFSVTEIDPNIHLNLIKHPFAHKFDFINLFNDYSLATQLIESDDFDKIIEICFSRNPDKIAAHYFEYFSKNPTSFYDQMSKIFIFINRLTSIELSADTLIMCISMISNNISSARRVDVSK